MEKVFTRKELYDLVWSEPIGKLAKRFNIVDYYLRKICIKAKIPLPQAGHWGKLRAGKKVRIQPLPENHQADPEITITIPEDGDPPIRKENAFYELMEELKADPKLKLTVPGRLTQPGKHIEAAWKSLTEKGRHRDNGLVRTYFDQIDMKVSPVNVTRALLFMDTLIKVLEARGHEISVGRDTHVAVGDVTLKILLRERLKITGDKNTFGSRELIPTGKLYFKLDNYPDRQWEDGRLSLEDQLPAIIARIEIQGKERLDQQIIWKRERELRKEEERIKQELRDRKKNDLKNFKQMLKDSKRWHKSVNLRNYLDTVEQRAIDNNKMTEDLSGWLTWARKKADWYDPFIKTEDDLLNEVDQNSLKFADSKSF